MSAQYSDTAFRLSLAAYDRLRAGAVRAGVPLARYFRIKASQLVRIIDPKFDVSGAIPHRRIDVGLSEQVLQGLRELCRDLGLPESAAGELVACATFAPKLNFNNKE